HGSIEPHGWFRLHEARELGAGAAQRSLVARLEDRLKIEDPDVEAAECVLADDGMGGHADLPRPGADLEDRLALERAVIEPALPGHHGARPAQPSIEVQRVEDEGSAGLQTGSQCRPQATRQAPGSSCQRSPTGVAREPL